MDQDQMDEWAADTMRDVSFARSEEAADLIEAAMDAWSLRKGAAEALVLQGLVTWNRAEGQLQLDGRVNLDEWR